MRNTGARASSDALNGLFADAQQMTERLLSSDHAADPLLAVEGVRLVTDALRSGLAMHVANPDPWRPRFVPMLSQHRKLWFDNPYTTYMYAPLRGDLTYRIWGHRGTGLYLGLVLYAGGTPGGMPTRLANSLNDRDLDIAADGSFEIILSPDEQPGNWLRLDRDASSTLLRQYFSDPTREIAATCHIDTIPPAGSRPELTDDALAERIDATRRFLSTVEEAIGALSTLNPQTNQFLTTAAGGTANGATRSGWMYPTPDNRYTFGRYELAPDQALVVDMLPPPCRYWSFYLSTPWQQSYDYGSGYGVVTNATAKAEPDGLVRLVIAHRDPGTPNWLDTRGHRHGHMCLRWLLPDADTPDVPTCRVVPLDQAANPS
jgi:hypothetical protein